MSLKLPFHLQFNRRRKLTHMEKAMLSYHDIIFNRFADFLIYIVTGNS